ncbi:hypothetical protein B0H63DRAFT_509286 [Podospora didyma]|uniref:Uncharacterized protein n=1 Tax=Podospora didyma TaxID=330526 RepID=A0AAE0U1K0_9PEZI|nr:hypothetical protein B0H63DRAFT_509286 [Podospora didyma]
MEKIETVDLWSSPAASHPNVIRSQTDGDCKLSTKTRTFANRSPHTEAFLANYLLPISEVLSFTEVMCHVNASIDDRLLEVHTDKDDDGKLYTYPTLVDYRIALERANKRKVAFQLYPLHYDGVGSIRDDNLDRQRREDEQDAKERERQAELVRGCRKNNHGLANSLHIH